MYIALPIAAKLFSMSTFWDKIKETKLVKGTVYAIVGALSYPCLTMVNRLTINGMENLQQLPKKNVLFVSNHQTYFADVITFLHIFCAVSWRKKMASAFLIIYYGPLQE